MYIMTVFLKILGGGCFLVGDGDVVIPVLGGGEDGGWWIGGLVGWLVG